MQHGDFQFFRLLLEVETVDDITFVLRSLFRRRLLTKSASLFRMTRSLLAVFLFFPLFFLLGRKIKIEISELLRSVQRPMLFEN